LGFDWKIYKGIGNVLMKKSAGRKWNIPFGVISILAVVWLLGTATFILNVKDTRFVRRDMLGVNHNCFTAYATAAYLASTGAENIYSPYHYASASALPSSTPIHKEVLGIFRVDEFLYPPPFLILPYGLLVIFKSFFLMRTVWFVLTVITVTAALVGGAWWCGAFRSQYLLLLFPLLFCAPTVHTTLQIGNVHILVIAISLLAMIAFEEDHPLVGGALLGLATVTKVWPAILVIHLLMQRRWNAVFYWVMAVAVYTFSAFLLFGPAPYQDFITYGLPRVQSGEAFAHMRWYLPTVAENMSIFGIPHKLYALGLLPSEPPLLSPVLAWSFTVLIGMIIIAMGLRGGGGTQRNDKHRLIQVQFWLALLTLVQLRSPFLPWHYGVISTLWLLLFLAASRRGWQLGVIVVAWICLSLNFPIVFISETAGIGYTLAASLFIFGAIIVSLKQYYAHAYQKIDVFEVVTA
jgi:hypothetical protein